jgi:DNA mismatch repair protein MutS2
MRADARSAIDQVVERLRKSAGSPLPATPAGAAAPAATEPGSLEPGVRVTVGTLGLEGVVTEVHGSHAEVDVRGKRLRAALRDLRIVGGPAPAPTVRVNVDLQPRSDSQTDLNVIGCTVDEAIDRLEKFLDESTVADRRTIRIVHGHGTGQLRRAVARFLQDHPLIDRFAAAPNDQGGGGVTVAELKD